MTLFVGVAADPAEFVVVAPEDVVFAGDGGFTVVALPGCVDESTSLPPSSVVVEVADALVERVEVVGEAATAGVEIDLELTERDRVREFETCDWGGVNDVATDDARVVAGGATTLV